MANLYGPMQYRPNPSGLTLNSSPVGGWAPPAAPAPAPTGPGIMSFDDWRSQNSWKDFWRRPIHGDRGSRSTGAPVGAAMNMQRNAYDRYRLDALSGQLPGVGVGGGVQGPLALDSTAASFANFLNGRG